MLILCSNGLSSESLRMEVREHMHHCRTAALVVTPSHIYKKQDYSVPRCTEELESLGLSVTLFDIDEQPADELLYYDVVEFIGGNPFYLMQSIRRSDAGPALRRLAKEKILIGWSASAFAFGPTLELVNMYSPEMNTVGLTDLRGLALTDLEVLPHYDRYADMFDRFEERCCEYEEARNTCVIRLNDGEGIILD